ncbi:MAG TPA: glutamine--tRNA ligase/YqeY domain fusion protein [Saprospiraceae bacterium]|nr:glutamine--tRNA ligase/YqeY domain fusion protein [Saprospiraceae bacterium]
MDNKKVSLNFIEHIIEGDLTEGKYQHVHTRFPPEPNGYLHIGHVKAIWVNFNIAAKYGGKTNLRFDDTNPSTEETEYVESIKEDIRWLGYDWENREYYASDYFPVLYEYAVKLIEKGLAYVDDSTSEQIAGMKGTPAKPGLNSPYRDRSVEENLNLFRQMKEGVFESGSRVLRAKIDMGHPNMLMRDPLMYRIKKENHHRTGDEWCIYPMYDFAHGQSDSIEKITHSLCSLEFIHHRELYDWFIQNLEIFPSKQTEFARMNVSFMITSKRKLLQLVRGALVDGWDDPRMPTIAGMRRRGIPPSALRLFCEKTGIARRDILIEIELLEACIREELNKMAQRVMVVTQPILVEIENYPEDQVEWLEAENNPEDPDAGSRLIPFSKYLYIEEEDFMENAPARFFRMSPGRNVRLKHGYILHCLEAVKDFESGKIEKLKCTYFSNTKSGEDMSGIKAKGTLHWVSAPHALDCEIRNYDRLFTVEDPTGHESEDFLQFYNPNSLQVLNEAKMEPGLKDSTPGTHFQFLRKGYYIHDKDSTSQHIIFNRIITLKDSWAKDQSKV